MAAEGNEGKRLFLFNLFGLPDAQDYLGILAAESREEAEALGARIFGGPVIAVAEGESPPHRLPFERPLDLSELTS